VNKKNGNRLGRSSYGISGLLALLAVIWGMAKEEAVNRGWGKERYPTNRFGRTEKEETTRRFRA
jgi:hypothetical protein